MPEFSTANCLEKFAQMSIEDRIDGEMRARMVDWMIEVLTNFKCDDQTFFLACTILDRYFKNTTESLCINDLHVMGVTSMFIASKFEDI